MFSESDRHFVQAQTEFLCVHSHGDTEKLGKVENREFVSEFFLRGVELKVAEGTYIDDVFGSACYHVLKVLFGVIHGEIALRGP